MVKNTFSLNLFIPIIFWNLSKEKNGAIFLIIKDHLHPTEIIIWVAPPLNLMLFFWGCSENVAAAARRRMTRTTRPARKEDFANYERLRESDKNACDLDIKRQQTSSKGFSIYKREEAHLKNLKAVGFL